jgi:hypothetical protein
MEWATKFVARVAIHHWPLGVRKTKCTGLVSVVVSLIHSRNDGERKMESAAKWTTARAEGGTHDGEEFDVSEETVGLLLNSRRNPVMLEYYELVLYMRGNLLMFVREYNSEERRVAFGGTTPFEGRGT